MSYSTAFPQALEILICVHFDSHKQCHHFLSTREISEELKIPIPTTAKVISKLIQAKLLTSKEGAKGGVILTRSLEDITLFEVFQAVEFGNPLFKMPLNIDQIEYDEAKVILAKGLKILEGTEEHLHLYLKKIKVSALIL